MVTLTLTYNEAEYLHDVLEMWKEGYDDATQEVIDDSSLADTEQWLEAVNGMREHRECAEDIIRKLKVARLEVA